MPAPTPSELKIARLARETEKMRKLLIDAGLSPADADREAPALADLIADPSVATREEIEEVKRGSGHYNTI